MFTTQKYLPWRHPERARFLLSARLTSSHPVRVLVLSAPLPPRPPSYIHIVSRKQECEEFMFPPLEGCMLCFIRVESHDNFRNEYLGFCLDDHLCVSLQQLSVQSSVNFLSVGLNILLYNRKKQTLLG